MTTFPESFLGLETSCPDTDPYDNFTLNCTATKPNAVLSDLILAWTHNGTIESGVIYTTISSNITTVTNILSFSRSSASDTGTYQCIASIKVSDSSIVAISEESFVTLKSKFDEYLPSDFLNSYRTKSSCCCYQCNG